MMSFVLKNRESSKLFGFRSDVIKVCVVDHKSSNTTFYTASDLNYLTICIKIYQMDGWMDGCRSLNGLSAICTHDLALDLRLLSW